MKNKGALIKIFLYGYIIFCMIFLHDEIGNEIRESLRLWAGVLIPSLFPYLVLAQYITSSDFMEIFYPIKKFVHKIFNISSMGANVYLCSLISGYPSGAICVAQLYKDKNINKEEAERLVCFTNNAGPLFVISVVGTNMLRSTSDGLALYLIQIISAMAVGIYLGKRDGKVPFKSVFYKNKGLSLDRCTQSAINTMLVIGAFLVLASVITTIAIESFGKLPVYGKKLSPYAKAFIYCITEISSAAKNVSLFGNTTLIFSILSGVLSWSGLCVIMQIKSVLPDDISITKIIRCKIWQSGISFCLAIAYKSFLDFNFYFNPDKAFVVSIASSVFIFGLFIFRKMCKKN